MGDYDFDKDFSREQDTTAWLIATLPQLYPEIEKVTLYTGDRRQGDLVLHLKNGLTKTVEFKEDFYHAKSGNIAIEEFCRGKDSGIKVTKSDVWLQIVHMRPPKPKELFFIPTSVLKQFIEDRKSGNSFVRLHKNGGDEGSGTHNWLINYEYLKKFKEGWRKT